MMESLEYCFWLRKLKPLLEILSHSTISSPAAGCRMQAVKFTRVRTSRRRFFRCAGAAGALGTGSGSKRSMAAFAAASLSRRAARRESVEGAGRTAGECDGEVPGRPGLPGRAWAQLVVKPQLWQCRKILWF